MSLSGNKVYGLYYNGKRLGYRVSTILGTYDIQVSSVYYMLEEQNKKNLVISNGEYVFGSKDNIRDISDNSNLVRLILEVLELGEIQGISALICDSLKREISKYSDMNCRYYASELDKFLNHGGLVELFGVRRTGKTVSIFQAIDRLLKSGVKEEEIIYLCLTKENSITSEDLNILCRKLLNNGIKYLFIDEITYIEGNLNFSTLFSDFYGDRSIVLTGTDSAVFIDVNHKALFGRVNVISTSYISYKEFNHLYEGSTLLDYIKMGGLLRSSEDYEKRGIWNVDDFAKYGLDYVGTSITDNLINYFRSVNESTRYPVIEEYFKYCKEAEIKTLIYKWIQNYSSCLTPSILNRKFKSNDLGNLLDILLSKSNVDLDLVKFLKDEASDLLIKELGLKEVKGKVPDDFSTNIRRYFKDIECYRKIGKKEIIFPIAIRYGFACEVIRILCDKLDIEITNTISNTIINSVEGCLMEESIRLNMAMLHLECSPYNDGRVEIDIVTENDLIEVKRTNKVGLYQMEWLVSDEINEKFGNSKRLVLLTNCEDEGTVECSQYDCYVEIRKSILEKKGYISEDFNKKLSSLSKVKRTVHYLNASKYLLNL